MSDEEKQLTVAELLERAQANRGGAAQRSAGRRRRRSLEDGGISVAELTGSLSRVKDKPAEARHSSVPIDTPESERRSRKAPSQPHVTPSVTGFKPTPAAPPTQGEAQPAAGRGAGSAAPSAGTSAPGATGTRPTEPPRPASSGPRRTPAATSPIKPAPGVASRRPDASNGAAARGAAATSPVAQNPASIKTSPSANQAGSPAAKPQNPGVRPEAPAAKFGAQRAGVPQQGSAQPASAQRLSARPEAEARGQVPQAVPRARGEQTAVPQGKAAWPIPDSALRSPQRPGQKAPAGQRTTGVQGGTTRGATPEPSTEETAVISTVRGSTQKRAQGGVQPAAAAAKVAAADKADAAEETGRIPRVGDENSALVASLYQRSGRGTQAGEEETAKNAGQTEAPREAGAVATGANRNPEGAAPGKESPKPAEAAKKKREPEPRGGAGSAVLLAVMGVVFGALVFIGFDQLWSSGLSRILVGVLAVAVTGIMVGVVHALRTARDGISMGLAAVVGFLMTFGPYIPHML